MENRKAGPRNPLVDAQNPFYCPTVPAATYLKNLRQNVTKQTNHTAYDDENRSLFNAFAKMVEQSGEDDSDADFVYDSENDWVVGRAIRSPQPPKKRRRGNTPYLPPQSLVRKTLYNKSFSLDADNSMATDTFDAKKNSPRSQSTVRTAGGPLAKRKRDSIITISDRFGSPRHGLSESVAQNISFEFEAKRERIVFDGPSSPVCPISSPQVSFVVDPPPTWETALRAIEGLFPGLRLRDRLPDNKDQTDIQEIVNMLADQALLTPAVLEILAGTWVFSLDLTGSLADENGLNICQYEVFSVLGRQSRGFQGLSELSLRGVRIRDFDLVSVARLENLETLHLDNTGIGNEGVYLLLPLKHTLWRLSLSGNPLVDSDCVTVLLYFNLAFLSLKDTNVDMVGIRKLAAAAYTGRLEGIDIEIPTSCERYISGMASMYLVHPPPDLVVDPLGCDTLTVPKLKRNLAAHARVNPAIAATGTSQEMKMRLRELLQRREADMIVAQMLQGGGV